MRQPVDERGHLVRAAKIIIALSYYMASVALYPVRLLTNRRGTCVILMYHEVTARQRKLFARQIEKVARWATPVAPDSGPPWPPAGARCVAITFDDAFQGLIHNALPTLLQHRIRAAIFVPTGSIGGRPCWLSDQENSSIGELVMTEEQIRSLDDFRVEIGAHSVTHPRLPDLDDDAAVWELRTAKERLEQLIARPVTLFAFPYGAFDARTLRLARECGYHRAFAAQPISYAANWDGFLTGRIGVSPDDWPLEFWLKVHGAYQWSPLASKAKRWAGSMLRRRPDTSTISCAE